MRWIREHKILTAFICAFLVICVILCASYLSRGSSSTVGKAIQKATAFVSEPLANVVSGIGNGARGVFQFKSVLAENEALKKENMRLEKELIDVALTQKELQELRELSNALNYQSTIGTGSVATANIIALDSSNGFRIFTIDKGTESGIEKDGIVVNGIDGANGGAGLVGRVLETGEGWSKVISVIDESNKVSFQVFRELTLMGIVQGDGTGNLSGFMFEAGAAIIEGDLLITSGIGLYPQGIQLGKVTSVTYNDDTQLKTITAESLVDFTSLKKVAVIL